MDEEEIAAIREVMKTHARRLRKLQKLQATIGLNRQPELDMEIEDIEKIIATLREKIDNPQLTLSPLTIVRLISLLEHMSETDKAMANQLGEINEVLKGMVSIEKTLNELFNRILTVVEDMQTLTRTLTKEISITARTTNEAWKGVYLLNRIAEKNGEKLPKLLLPEEEDE